ncbi:MAG: hypothetical protein LC792_22620 [Actinobacteria bacterium]|nr:hypothetical protein [Actinomycetota bacterium]
MTADGSGRWSLATSGIIELAWAPDGKRFAATVGLPDGTRDVFLLDGGGKVVRQVTDTHGIPGGLSWSPDGSVVAYTRASEAPASGLWAVSADGGDPVLVAENAIGASWSPDGCRVATATPDGAAVMRWDGTDRRLIPDSAHRTPQFSPTGDLISLEAQAGDGILVLAAEDLTSAERVFDGNAYGLQWSPDGTRIAFYGRNPTSALTDFEVSSIKADGTALLNLSSDPENDVQPHW